ncbi:hypothetical protein BG842_14770 [Haladaptatus sp. W1]|uniref:DUF5518 domain-containing protein n=1 Tax=Haladaptatus sp. W1 TaxID=1897478 RepID=UPI000849730B|nr:DUF5518 domain-containing protein [Haladaptatus sp. W1]ODR83044.1 hypothetical protein BG842_14770 [Haladaptatus sp. W1]
MTDNNNLIHALIGAVVTLVVSFVPFSPVLGGAVAAYLGRTTPDEGLRVGAISGAIAAIPMAVVGLFVVSIISFGHMPGGFVALLFLLGMFAMLYTVGLSALGGYLGAYLADEF